MRSYMMMTAVTAAVATLAALSPAAAGAEMSGPQGGSGTSTRAQQAASGAQLWVSRYNGPGNGGDSATSVAVRGTRVFVFGGSAGRANRADYATVAYSATTGKRMWASRYYADDEDYARSMAVNAAGTRVYVTGSSYRTTTGYDYATVAYNAATGRQLWARRYNGPANGDDDAFSVAVNPAGTKVFVTGVTNYPVDGQGTGADYATVAYSSATGRQLWVRHYNGPGNGTDEALSVAVNPRGTAVYVTGGSDGHATGLDYATVAYSSATGRQLWARRYTSAGNGNDVARSVAVNPTGTRVYVTGYSGDDYATVAYNAATGRQLWARRYTGPGELGAEALSVAVNPHGTAVFVTGYSAGLKTGYDYATVAYSAATGRQLWARRYNGPGNSRDVGQSIAVNPAGTRVYVTGYSTGRATGADYATVAYSAATGRQLWLRRYTGPGNRDDYAYSLAVGPAGTRVYVTGYSTGRVTGADYATIAYHG